MSGDTERTSLQLRSLVKSSGELELSLASVEVPQPGPNEVVLRVEAAPINPSDLGLLFGPADLGTAKQSGSPERPVITATIPEAALKGLRARIDQSMPVGNEGAGVVVGAGSSPAAQALKGKTVAALGGAMYAQYRTVSVEQCLLLAEGTTPAEGASSFINPMTALGMVETLRHEGHHALVHTAAASSLGQMLVRVCLEDKIDLVNVVRKAEQEKLLRDLGAKYVVSSASPNFIDELTEAIAATGATLAFDAIGGGKLAGQILGAMESALNRKATTSSRYGSPTHKQVYLYGALDSSPTELRRNYGMAWGIGGWLVFPYLQKIGAEATARLKARVAAELKTLFATRYGKEVSLTEVLQLSEIAQYSKRETGGKFLIVPHKGRS